MKKRVPVQYKSLISLIHLERMINVPFSIIVFLSYTHECSGCWAEIASGFPL